MEFGCGSFEELGSLQLEFVFSFEVFLQPGEAREMKSEKTKENGKQTHEGNLKLIKYQSTKEPNDRFADLQLASWL